MRFLFPRAAGRLLWTAVAAMGMAAPAWADSTPVKISNQRAAAVYVSFSNTQGAGSIAWGAGCVKTGATGKASYALVKPGKTCAATVSSTNGSSRFCAAAKAPPANCWEAQANHLTMIETNFEPASAPGCFGGGSCVWYDISVIPSTCTDEAWRRNQCEGQGGASYNLPVSLSCVGNPPMPHYVCRGPKSTKYGSEMYPSNCGNPHGTCAVGTFPNGQPCENGVATYFFPMFTPPENAYQPNAVCIARTLAIDILAGK
jgi:hypothetical protein